MNTITKQYKAILNHILDNGDWVTNRRTGVDCLTVLNQQINWTPADGSPVITLRPIAWKKAIAEMICYMRGYTTLEQFHSLGVHTWDANAQAWHNLELNPNLDQVGIIYGASAEMTGKSYKDIVGHIKRNPSDRGIIWNFWNPEYFNKGCLRPCMFNHQFNVINGKLYLTSTQRSADFLLGSAWNIIQCQFLLVITAHLTDLEVGGFTLNMSNVHIYENQLKSAVLLSKRDDSIMFPDTGFSSSYLTLENLLTSPDIMDYFIFIDDILATQVLNKIKTVNPTIKIPFTV